MADSILQHKNICKPSGRFNTGWHILMQTQIKYNIIQFLDRAPMLVNLAPLLYSLLSCVVHKYPQHVMTTLRQVHLPLRSHHILLQHILAPLQLYWPFNNWFPKEQGKKDLFHVDFILAIWYSWWTCTKELDGVGPVDNRPSTN